MEIVELISESRCVIFSFTFQDPLVEKARIIFSLFEEKAGQEPKKILTSVLKQPFKKELKISELQPLHVYKFRFCLENGPDLIVKNLFASTKGEELNKLNSIKSLEGSLQSKMAYNTKKPSKASGMSLSEDFLYKAATTNAVNKHVFKSEKEIIKKVMDARKANSTSDYINESYKVAKPAANKQERLKRTLLVAQGIELYENIYGYREGNNIRNGIQFGGNDWFMGPFYSYDKNSTDMHMEHQKRLLKAAEEMEESNQLSESTNKTSRRNFNDNQYSQIDEDDNESEQEIHSFTNSNRISNNTSRGGTRKKLDKQENDKSKSVSSNNQEMQIQGKRISSAHKKQ